MVDEFDNSEDQEIEEVESIDEAEIAEAEDEHIAGPEPESGSIRNFDDNSKADNKKIVLRELKAFKESNDKGAINSMYWTELKAFDKAWNAHKRAAQAFGIKWDYDPRPAMKANRFYTKAFGHRVN